MSHVSVQVIAPVLTDFFHCLHCEQLVGQAGIGQQVHQEMLEQYPEDIIQEAARLANWLHDLAHRYGDQIHIQVIDAQSPQGLVKSLRYWVHKYPTFIVDGRDKVTGWDQAALDAILQTRIASTLSSAF
jgi:hypothetical protein